MARVARAFTARRSTMKISRRQSTLKGAFSHPFNPSSHQHRNASAIPLRRSQPLLLDPSTHGRRARANRVGPKISMASWQFVLRHPSNRKFQFSYRQKPRPLNGCLCTSPTTSPPLSAVSPSVIVSTFASCARQPRHLVSTICHFHCPSFLSRSNITNQFLPLSFGHLLTDPCLPARPAHPTRGCLCPTGNPVLRRSELDSRAVISPSACRYVSLGALAFRPRFALPSDPCCLLAFPTLLAISSPVCHAPMLPTSSPMSGAPTCSVVACPRGSWP